MDLSRRTALSIGIAACLNSIARKAPAQELSGKKVIVIGAGLAGLAAAQNLKSQGADVIVYEAGDYIGGRVRTDWSLGAPFEFGAGWIHGPSFENPIRQIAESQGLKTYRTSDESLQVFDLNGDPQASVDNAKIDEFYERLESIFDRAWSHPAGTSLQQAIIETDPEFLNDPLGLWMISAYTEFELGAGIADISARNAFEDEIYDGEDVIILAGYDKILAPLASGLDIRLNSPVRDVFYGDDQVIVDGETSDFVVCAVPLGVLKAEVITFEPALPMGLQSAIDEIGFGTVTKIAMKFDDAFWDLDTQYFGMMTQTTGRWNYWLNYRTFSNENILLGLSFGTYAPVADAMSQSKMTQDALQVLRNVWGGEVTEPLEVITTHWSQEPYFRGAYSFPQTGGTISQFESFADPVAGRLFFAGEHTIFSYHSTTHGALKSGVRAAEAILDA